MKTQPLHKRVFRDLIRRGMAKHGSLDAQQIRVITAIAKVIEQGTHREMYIRSESPPLDEQSRIWDLTLQEQQKIAEACDALEIGRNSNG